MLLFEARNKMCLLEENSLCFTVRGDPFCWDYKSTELLYKM